MNDERVTRRTLPQVTVGMPLSLLMWVDERAEEAGVSRSRWIVSLIERERIGSEASDARIDAAEAVCA